MSKEQNNDDSVVQDEDSVMNYILDKELKFRRLLDEQLNDKLIGKILHHCSAIMAGTSSIVYVVLTYSNDCPIILERWYN